jgi:Protein of unknown function (DUF1217)
MTTYDPSILSLFSSITSSSANTADSALLSVLYGNGTSASQGASGQSPVQALLSAQRNETAGVQTTAQQPDVQTAMAAFTKAVTGATSLNAALANPAVLNVLLTANGMSDQIGNTALATKVLTSNLNDPNSLANVLTDTRWQTLAQTYDLSTNGLSVLQNPNTIAAITQGYAQVTWENNQDAATPGISDALAFIQQAGSITSVDGLLSNATVRNVVTTALGVPEQIAFQSINAQEQAISSRLDVNDLQDPTFVQNFAERYLIMNNMNSSSSSSTSSTDITTLATQLAAAGG